MAGDGIVNVFAEDSDINVIKSWLIGSTDGQTYSISDRFLPRINGHEFQFDCIDGEWNDIIGYKHDYKIGDPELDKEANRMLNDINEFIKNVNENPEKYFGKNTKKKYVVHLSAVVDNVIEGMFESEAEARAWAESRGRALLSDKCLDGVDDDWHWDGNINIESVEQP